ncbi:hypothetical protein BVRB_8g194030 [Beta vulgaris subsp. vulgaris]|nr:hypothetical protein BVRB_8g194030 [Beta vulgaris subsp. vulgaris]
MDNDRSWMHIQGFNGRKQGDYKKGVKEFLDFAFRDTAPNSGVKLRCPCLNCRNYFDQDRDTMRAHLFRVGIDPDYNPWIFHGEEQSFEVTDEEMSEEEGDDFKDEDPLVSDDLASLVREATNVVVEPQVSDDRDRGDDELPDKFHKLMKDAQEELYPGCKTFSRLEFIVTLLQLKVSGRWSDKSFNGLLNALHKAFNYDVSFPKSSYEAKKRLRQRKSLVLRPRMGDDSEANTSTSTTVTQTEADNDPMYLKLWRKTKQ